MEDDSSYDDLSESSESDATMIVESPALQQVQSGTDRSQAYVIVIAGPHTGRMFKIDRNETVLGRSPSVDLTLQDVGVSRSHARILTVGDHVFVEDMQSANGTFLNGERVSVPQALQDGDKITLGSTTILKFTYHDKLDEDFQKKMFEAALRDGLTQAYNKKYFTNHLHSEFAFALRHKSALTLIMYDVDHFKNLNDTWGHLAGDQVLVKLAKLSMQSIRAEDTFARYGGEEFAVVARGISQGHGLMLAERLRAQVENFYFDYNNERLPVTISLGVASYPEVPANIPEDLIEAADAALYRAKEAGRNRACMADT
jgi:diguanylate cyclase (GGDEF)-like protein